MLRKIRESSIRYLMNCDGVETVEYAIVTGLIVAATIIVMAVACTSVFLTFLYLPT